MVVRIFTIVRVGRLAYRRLEQLTASGRPLRAAKPNSMRVKLYLMSLLPNAVVSGWVTFHLAHTLGPLMIAPRDIAFVLVMTFVALGTFALLNLILMLVLGLRWVHRSGDIVLVERSELARDV